VISKPLKAQRADLVIAQCRKAWVKANPKSSHKVAALILALSRHVVAQFWGGLLPRPYGTGLLLSRLFEP